MHLQKRRNSSRTLLVGTVSLAAVHLGSSTP